MMPIYQGIESVLMPKFEMAEFLRCIDAYQVTHAWVVPPICFGLLGYPRESIYYVEIEAGLSSEGSAKELQIDLTQNDHLMCGPSPCWSPTDTPEKVQHRWSDRTHLSGYARHHFTRRSGM